MSPLTTYPSLYLDEAVNLLVAGGASREDAEQSMLWLARRGALLVETLPCEHWRHPLQPVKGIRPPILDIKNSSMFVAIDDGRGIREQWALVRAPEGVLPVILHHLLGGQPFQVAATATAAIAAARSSAAVAASIQAGQANDDADDYGNTGTRTQAAAKAEEECGAWLAELASDEKFRPVGRPGMSPKETLCVEARDKFRGLSENAFARQWRAHAPPTWTAPGRRGSHPAG